MNTPPRSNTYSEQMHDVSTHQYDSAKEKKWVREKKPKLKKLYLFLLLIVLLGIVGSSVIVSVQYSTKYHNDFALANTGIKHLQTGLSLIQRLAKNPLDASTTTQAQQEFAA